MRCSNGLWFRAGALQPVTLNWNSYPSDTLTGLTAEQFQRQEISDRDVDRAIFALKVSGKARAGVSGIALEIMEFCSAQTRRAPTLSGNWGSLRPSLGTVEAVAWLVPM